MRPPGVLKEGRSIEGRDSRRTVYTAFNGDTFGNGEPFVAHGIYVARARDSIAFVPDYWGSDRTLFYAPQKKPTARIQYHWQDELRKGERPDPATIKKYEATHILGNERYPERVLVPRDIHPHVLLREQALLVVATDTPHREMNEDQHHNGIEVVSLFNGRSDAFDGAQQVVQYNVHDDGAVLGGMHHPYAEMLLLVDGAGELYFTDADTGRDPASIEAHEIVHVPLEPGQPFTIPADQPHALRMKEGALLLGATERPYRRKDNLRTLYDFALPAST